MEWSNVWGNKGGSSVRERLYCIYHNVFTIGSCPWPRKAKARYGEELSISIIRQNTRSMQDGKQLVSNSQRLPKCLASFGHAEITLKIYFSPYKPVSCKTSKYFRLSDIEPLTFKFILRLRLGHHQRNNKKIVDRPGIHTFSPVMITWIRNYIRIDSAFDLMLPVSRILKPQAPSLSEGQLNKWQRLHTM